MRQMLNAISQVGLGFGISAVIIVILLLVICYKNWPDETKMFLKVSACILIFAVVPCFAVYCGVEANIYYGAEGGIFGQLKNSLNINTGKVTTDTFEISELNLRLDENREYSATIRVDLDTFESKLILNPNKKYMLFVNNALTSDNFMRVTGDSIAMSANYTYLFNDFQKNEIGSDTLHISFNFNKNDIVCRVSSAGDSTMRDLWGLYYRKNGMKIKFVESDYTKPPISNEGEGDVSGLCSLVFNDGETSVTKICNKNTVFSDVPTVDAAYGYTFAGWSTDGENIFDFTQPITENLEFTPIFTKKATKWVSSGYYMDGQINFEQDVNLAYYETTITEQENTIVCYSAPEKFLNVKVKIDYLEVDSGSIWGRGCYLKPDFTISDGEVENFGLWYNTDDILSFSVYGHTLNISFEVIPNGSSSAIKIKIANACGSLGFVKSMSIYEFQYLVEA